MVKVQGSPRKPVKAVESIPKKQRHEAIRPRVCSENVENPQLWATESDSAEQVELEVGFAVQLALDVVLQDELGELQELASLDPDVSEEREQVVRRAVPVCRSVVDVAEGSAEQPLPLRLIDWQPDSLPLVVASLLLHKVLREDDPFQQRHTSIRGSDQMSEDNGNVEVRGGRELTSRLDFAGGEHELANLGAQDHPEHRLLDERPRAADVWTAWDDRFFAVVILLFWWDEDVAMLHTGKLFAEDQGDHLLSEDGAGHPPQVAVDVLLEQVQHPLGDALHQARLALRE